VGHYLILLSNISGSTTDLKLKVVPVGGVGWETDAHCLHAKDLSAFMDGRGLLLSPAHMCHSNALALGIC